MPVLSLEMKKGMETVGFCSVIFIERVLMVR